MGLRDGCFLRRRRRRVLRVVQELDVPERLQLQHLSVHPLDGHPRRDGQCVGGHLRRGLPRLSEPGGARKHRALDQPAPRYAPGRAAIPVRNLRGDHRAHDVDPARGADS